MVKIIGVRFRGAGKIYSFDPGQLELKAGDKVIVETVKGMEMGTVALGVREVNEESLEAPLKPVLRMATQRDLEEEARHRQLEKEARPIFYQKMRERELDMKLVEVEYFFDNSKIMFYYTSESRVDFRELVKDLASAFHARIELRQIGVRNETQYFGGIGVCGRELCCHSFLSDFGSVTIKMAKDQELPLTSTKISGVCGRLMCCLQNEHESYLYLNQNMPNVGDVVKTNDGLQGEIIDKSIIRQKVKVRIVNSRDEREVKEYQAGEVERLYTKKEYAKMIENGEVEVHEPHRGNPKREAIDKAIENHRKENAAKNAGKPERPSKHGDKPEAGKERHFDRDKRNNERRDRRPNHEAKAVEAPNAQPNTEEKNGGANNHRRKNGRRFGHGGYENQPKHDGKSES